MCSARVFELAVACAYAIFDCEDSLEVMGQLCAGYNAQIPLQEVELESLLPATAMRLVQSLTIAAQDSALDPDNEDSCSSESGAWKALQTLAAVDPMAAALHLRQACGLERGLASTTAALGRDQILQARGESLGPSLSLSYQDSLEIVRGRGAWLFDAGGRGYLDGVNNVCHVGHCHPHVVTAGQQQMVMLNTNTRYLHQNIARYAKRLTGLFPEHLSVCFFVNSGSEANELAIRMARNFTGRRNILSLDGGYHGNTSTMVDISPYKHDGPGGAGAPHWLTTVPCPDTYRGRYRANDPEAAAKYAQEIAHSCERAAERNSGYAALIAEPLIGCGGQIVPPHGYLRQAFEHAREAGVLCIADEVQIGFGRVGESWWGFQLDDARPDIVTLGKPIGNGHPLAAVITTPDIAAAFANGMEYFNTFGGNPVSCAIGMAVLDVIENEGLLQRACELGQRFREGFRRLADHHECLGDVRGVGLYIGVEIVKDRQSREPDAPHLAQAIERARHAGILFSGDGPHHNVLKIKPPMCWTQTEVDLALAVMDRALPKESDE
ncbi:MAG: 4-aminobutyrate aminotransferase-like enzyme [Pseudohongiellaceae bacterium]